MDILFRTFTDLDLFKIVIFLYYLQFITVTLRDHTVPHFHNSSHLSSFLSLFVYPLLGFSHLTLCVDILFRTFLDYFSSLLSPYLFRLLTFFFVYPVCDPAWSCCPALSHLLFFLFYSPLWVLILLLEDYLLLKHYIISAFVRRSYLKFTFLRFIVFFISYRIISFHFPTLFLLSVILRGHTVPHFH